MALPSSGEISMHDINTELGDSDVNSKDQRVFDGAEWIWLS